VGHGGGGFAGAKVRFFELWRIRLCGYARIGGFDLLAVDVDGDSSCAALCHKLLFWQSWHKCPLQAGTVPGKHDNKS